MIALIQPQFYVHIIIPLRVQYSKAIHTMQRGITISEALHIHSNKQNHEEAEVLKLELSLTEENKSLIESASINSSSTQ